MPIQKSLPEQKKDLRAQARGILTGTDAAMPGELERQIADRLIRMEEFGKAGSVFIYVGFGFEVPTRDIILRALREGKEVFVPKCVGAGIMHAVRIRSLDELVKGSMGIPEPPDTKNSVPKTAIGFAVVPALACDRLGTRLGRGGGYYDRFLKTGRLRSAALCRSRLLYDLLPREPFDEPVDMVVTETEVVVP